MIKTILFLQSSFKIKLYIVKFVRSMEEVDTNCIVDRYFYECYKKMSGQISKYLYYYSLRSIILLFAIPTNHYIFEEGKNETLSLFSVFLIVTLIVSILEMVLYSYLHFKQVKNKSKIIKIAQELHHTKQMDGLKSVEREEYDELTDLYEIQESLGLKVSSTYYDFENMEKVNDVSTEFKEMREKTGQNTIRVALQSNLKYFRWLERLLQLGSAAIIIFGFVVGSISPINEVQHSLLELILISQVIIKPRIFAILIAICLIPIIVVLMCVYFCICKKQKKKAKLPEKMQVTTETITKCSDCSICFQDFVSGEDIAILPCAQSHIFHYTCIEGWTKIKPNCPICRKQLCE